MNVSEAQVLLVGSLPLPDAEQTFRAVSRALSDKIGWIPDGEFGERITWTPMLPEFVYSRFPFDGSPTVTGDEGLTKHPDLEEIVAPPNRTVEPPPISDMPIPTDMDGFWTFRIKPGRHLRFDDLLYGRVAVDSYRVFKRLRDEGVVPPGVRFQVSLPSVHSSIDPFFEDTDEWPVVYAAYMDGLRGEIDKILAVAPSTDLAFQWDCANEIVDVAMGTSNSMKWHPRCTVEEKIQRHAAQLGALGDAVPDGAVLGFHWCYGTWGGWPAVAMPDLGDCVRFSNEAVQRITRHVDYVHMPVITKPDDAFFAPLANLHIGTTKVFLGIVHHLDSIDDFRRRRDLARRYLPDFGIASVCGYGRVPPEDAQDVLDLHAANASEL